MLGDLLAKRYFVACIILLALVIAVSLFYRHRVEREVREREAKTERFLEGLENKETVIRRAELTETAPQERTNGTFEVDSTGGDASDMPLLETTVELPIIDFDALPENQSDTDVDETLDEPENGVDPAEIQQTIQFINSQFVIASELCYEEYEIKKRRRRVQGSDGTNYYEYPPGDEERLQEIQYEYYDALAPIGEEVPGAVEVRLHQHPNPTGWVGCQKYIFPKIFEEVLGSVPDGYYQFEAAILPLIKPPSDRR